jgi:hypothetical protein
MVEFVQIIGIRIPENEESVSGIILPFFSQSEAKIDDWLR